MAYQGSFRGGYTPLKKLSSPARGKIKESQREASLLLYNSFPFSFEGEGD